MLRLPSALLPWVNVCRLDVLIAKAFDFVLPTLLVEANPGCGHDLPDAFAFVVQLNLEESERVIDRSVRCGRARRSPCRGIHVNDALTITASNATLLSSCFTPEIPFESVSVGTQKQT